MIIVPIPHTMVIFFGQPTDGVLYCILPGHYYLQSTLYIICITVSPEILNHLLPPNVRLWVMNINSNPVDKEYFLQVPATAQMLPVATHLDLPGNMSQWFPSNFPSP
jgi:hypothetical protein